jgi:hypothetical protein
MSTQFRPDTIIRCTFGTYTQTGPWDDRREMTWANLAIHLTRHEVGSKEGTSWVPASFRGTARKKEDAEHIEVAVLDCDAGHSLDQIKASLAARGWAAIIVSTHSHGTSRLRVKRRHWNEFCGAAPAPERSAADFLLSKGYLPQIAGGARVVSEDGEHVVIEHQPCPKFRIVVPLLTPWKAASYADQASANAAWKERIEALASALGLDHDQACTDTSRLFYLPRRPENGTAPEFAVLEGTACDLFGLPAVSSPAFGESRKGAQRLQDVSRADELTFSDFKTGEIVDLRSWARDYAGRFEIVTALQARRPEIFTGKVADGTKYHIRCVNEGAHTQPGLDGATFIVNASQSTSRGFVYHCRHAHCDGQDRLWFLLQMLERGWLSIADLTDPAFLAPEGHRRPVIRIEGGEIASIVDQAEDALLLANLGLYQRGPSIVRTGTILAQVPRNGDIPVRQIVEVEEHALAEALTRAAEWEKLTPAPSSGCPSTPRSRLRPPISNVRELGACRCWLV